MKELTSQTENIELQKVPLQLNVLKTDEVLNKTAKYGEEFKNYKYQLVS